MRTLLNSAARTVSGLAAASLLLVAPAAGQVMQAQAFAQDGAQPAVHQAPYSTEGGYMDAHGDPIVNQTGYGAPCGSGVYGPGMCGPGMCGPGMCGPGGPFAGGGRCGGGLGICDGLLGAYMRGAQAGPHYFDFSAEYLNYQRDDAAFSDSVIFSSLSFANNDNLSDIEALPADQKLTGANLSSTEEGDGYRLTGRMDAGALSVVEFVWSNVLFDREVAELNSSGATTLFSVFSRFGTATNGPVGMNPDPRPQGTNFEETDDALRHIIDYDLELQTAEASYRRYWVCNNPRVSGTFLLGFRYTSLEEQLGFYSLGSIRDDNGTPGNFADDTLTPGDSISIDSFADNQLAGFQFGGDVWVTVMHGLRFGAEGKAGIYNNSYKMNSTVVASDGDPFDPGTPVEGDQVAFLTEAKLQVVADVTPNLSFRAGYEVLFMSELALVNDSLATVQPYGAVNGIDIANDPNLSITQSTTDGEVLFHGFNAGFEFVW